MVVRRPPATASEEEVRAYHRRVAAALEELGVPNGDEFHISAPAGLADRRFGPFARKSETSRQAAIATYPRQGSQRWRILCAVAGSKNGMTRDEIEQACDLGGNTVRPRVQEMINDSFLRETMATRTTRSGATAVVLVITDRARAEMANRGDLEASRG